MLGTRTENRKEGKVSLAQRLDIDAKLCKIGNRKMAMSHVERLQMKRNS